MSTTEHECPLSSSQQLRNVLLYSFNIAMTYFAAPVLYVGVLQSALCKELKTSDTIANLPGSAYLWATPIPVLVAWCFPQMRALKPLMVCAYLLEVLVSGLFLAALYTKSTPLIITMLITHGAVLGIANGVANTCLWELLGRGVSNKRRGLAFSLAFGFGPFLAVIGSLAAQIVLGGQESVNLGVVRPYVQPFLSWVQHYLGGQEYPDNYAIIFMACMPAMLACAISSSLIVVPLSETERQEPLRLQFDSSKLGLGSYFLNPLILIASIAYVLIYAAEQIQPNMNTYIQDLLGKKPAEFAGLSLALRFSCKIVAGFVLGWLTAYSTPKVTLYVTTLLCMAGIGWALRVPGEAYLFSFGLLGAGELFGNYFPNYIALCSRRDQVRRHMMFTNMITAISGFAGTIYGVVSDKLGILWSFYWAFTFAASTFAIILLLPHRPHPPAEDAGAKMQ